ncbi:hypothetical protein O181_115368 [Austropuccinia psidii MF-1]|uniref:Uncharacterized protein n=1 Tax=Austropuccinia psidii MF-1 TaxID=1389203 RepID=A0A9Q3K6G0_9BASI|nr:hypothetical protein [Austropuccinia psidii MF-1]
MTPNRSRSNYSIKSNGSGPGHSCCKSKIKECDPTGEAQMEDARTSTSSKRLASTFDTLIETPEADITAIPIFRPEPFPTDNNGDIPVSVQELFMAAKKKEWELLSILWIGTINSYLQVKTLKGPVSL